MQLLDLPSLVILKILDDCAKESFNTFFNLKLTCYDLYKYSQSIPNPPPPIELLCSQCQFIDPTVLRQGFKFLFKLFSFNHSDFWVSTVHRSGSANHVLNVHIFTDEFTFNSFQRILQNKFRLYSEFKLIHLFLIKGKLCVQVHNKKKKSIDHVLKSDFLSCCVDYLETNSAINLKTGEKKHQELNLFDNFFESLPLYSIYLRSFTLNGVSLSF